MNMVKLNAIINPKKFLIFYYENIYFFFLKENDLSFQKDDKIQIIKKNDNGL